MAVLNETSDRGATASKNEQQIDDSMQDEVYEMPAVPDVVKEGTPEQPLVVKN